MITVAGVEKRVAKIAKHQNDSEEAHSLEDRLYEDVLEAIAKGHPLARELAAAALGTKELHFPRWYA
jgi:hypothetical protein